MLEWGNVKNILLISLSIIFTGQIVQLLRWKDHLEKWFLLEEKQTLGIDKTRKVRPTDFLLREAYPKYSKTCTGRENLCWNRQGVGLHSA